MLNPQLDDPEAVRRVFASSGISTSKNRTQWPEVEPELLGLGFEPGWGRTVTRINETLQLLQDLLEAPGPGSWRASWHASR